MTDRDQLAARHAAAIRRHWRALADAGGQAPAALLDELGAIAEYHAYHAGVRTGEALKALAEEHSGKDPAGEPPDPAAAAVKPAPRRTQPRRSAK